MTGEQKFNHCQVTLDFEEIAQNGVKACAEGVATCRSGRIRGGIGAIVLAGIRFLVALDLVVLTVGACATAIPIPARLGLKLAPATLGTSISLQQHLTVQREDRIDELDAALEVDSERLDLVGLALGQRVLSLHYDGRELQTWRHSLLPAGLRGEDVLEDLQLTLWPLEAIRGALPAGSRVEEIGLRRTLLIGDVPVVVIDYSGEPHWNGKIELVNLRYHYRLTIQSVSTGS
jgi:uncharacterized protein DUF3261